MKYLFPIVGALQGLAIVAILALVKALAEAAIPDFTFPFSIWCGMLLSIPGIAMGLWIGRNFDE